MKKFIKEKLHEHLNLSKDSVNENIMDKKAIQKFVEVGVRTAFDGNKAAALKHLHKVMDGLVKMKDTVTLYRVVFVNDPKQIDTKNVGSHYVLNRRDLEKTHQQNSHVGGGKPFILKVSAPKSLIDLNATIFNNMEYPHETEITLKNKGVGAKIVNVEPFESNDEDLLGTPDDMGMDMDFDLY